MLVVWLTAVVAVAACLGAGHAALAVLRARPSWLAAPLGAALVLAAADAGAHLRADWLLTAVPILAVAAGILALAFHRPPRGAVLTGTAVVTIAILAASLPFALNGRVGIPGATVNQDSGQHLLRAHAILHAPDAAEAVVAGRPLAPHALVASLSQGPADIEGAYLALLLAFPALTAVAALALLGGARPGWRVLGAVLVGLPYLISAWIAQGAFRDPLLALLVLGVVVALHDAERSRQAPRATGMALAALAAGTVLAMGVSGLAWPVGLLAAAGGWWLARGRSLARGRAGGARPRVSPRLLVPVAVALLVAAPEVTQLPDLWEATGSRLRAAEDAHRGNLKEPLTGLEAVGLWPHADPRKPAGRQFGAVYGPVAMLAAAAAAAWWWRRGRRTVPLAAGVVLVVWLASDVASSPWYAAKALVVAAPVLMAMLVRAALAGAGEDRTGRAIASMGVLVLAAVSSAVALSAAVVRPSTYARDLSTLSATVAPGRTALLVHDGYGRWDLRDPELLTAPNEYGQAFDMRPSKERRALDFDTIEPALLAQLRFVVTGRAAYASSPPEGWVLVRTTRHHQLWERRRAGRSRLVLPEESNAPGALLDCATTRVPPRAVAAVIPAPRLGSPWREEGEGLVRTTRLRLGPGRWDLSLQYRSRSTVTVEAAGRRVRLPASLESRHNFQPAGRIATRGGDVPVRVDLGDVRGPEPIRTRSVGVLAATRVGARPHVVPMRRACGRYVDWYRVAG